MAALRTRSKPRGGENATGSDEAGGIRPSEGREAHTTPPGFETSPEILVSSASAGGCESDRRSLDPFEGPVGDEPVSRLTDEVFVGTVLSLEEGRDLAVSPNLSGGFDGVLLVVHASRTPKNPARETIDDLLEAGTNLLGVVLNGCS